MDQLHGTMGKIGSFRIYGVPERNYMVFGFQVSKVWFLKLLSLNYTATLNIQKQYIYLKK